MDLKLKCTHATAVPFDMAKRIVFHRWVSGPDGHLEDLGSVTLEQGGLLVFDPPSLHDLVSEPRYDHQSERKLSPDSEPVAWFNALGSRVWRGSDTAVAYGALFAVPVTTIRSQAAR
jgi:hypothetical protein